MTSTPDDNPTACPGGDPDRHADRRRFWRIGPDRCGGTAGRMEDATARYYNLSRLNARITVAIFIVSGIFAGLLAFVLSGARLPASLPPAFAKVTRGIDSVCVDLRAQSRSSQ